MKVMKGMVRSTFAPRAINTPRCGGKTILEIASAIGLSREKCALGGGRNLGVRTRKTSSDLPPTTYSCSAYEV